MLKLTHSKLKGEGLIETLITLLIIAVGSIALIRFQNYLAYSNSLTRQQSDATILAVQKIEQLRDFQVLNTMGGYTAYQGIVSGTSTSAGVTTTYTTTWTVTTNVNPTYKVIDVTVSWTDRYNNAKSVRLISNVAGIEPAFSAAVM